MAAGRAKEYRFDYVSFKPVLERQSDGAEVMDPTKTADETAAQAGVDGGVVRIGIGFSLWRWFIAPRSAVRALRITIVKQRHNGCIACGRGDVATLVGTG